MFPDKPVFNYWYLHTLSNKYIVGGEVKSDEINVFGEKPRRISFFKEKPENIAMVLYVGVHFIYMTWLLSVISL